MLGQAMDNRVDQASCRCAVQVHLGARNHRQRGHDLDVVETVAYDCDLWHRNEYESGTLLGRGCRSRGDSSTAG